MLSAFFHAESCSLNQVSLYDMSIGDDGAVALANGLIGNKSLKQLSWSIFPITLEAIGCRYGARDDIHSSLVERYLKLNIQKQYDVPICKILMSHSDLDMTPFFQWKLKLLPLVVA